MPHRRASNPVSHRLARLAFLLGLLVAVAIVAIGPLHRFERIDPQTALLGMRYGALAAIAAGLLGAITMVVGRPGDGRRGFVSGGLALLLGVGAAWIPFQWLYLSRSLPPINDITTDTVDPPPLLARRAGGNTPIAYEGARFAELQKRAYGDLAPLLLGVPQAEAFVRAEKLVTSMGWRIVDSDARSGRIDAVAQTLWFGFEDDVAIRIRPTAAGCRVDMRSRSRVGVSDLGANADRIRRFFRKLAG